LRFHSSHSQPSQDRTPDGELVDPELQTPQSFAEISIPGFRVAQTLGWTIFFLVCANIAAQLYKHYHPDTPFNDYLSLFFLDSENNIPSVYSSFTLLLSSALLGVIAAVRLQERDRFGRHWKWMAIIFFYLSIDELASIHELTINPLRQSLKAGGLLYYTWVVPAALLVIIFFLAYLKFLQALPKPSRRLFLLSGGIYIGGALITELVEGWYEEAYSQHNLGFAGLTTFEETLEMAAIAIFIYTLLLYIRRYIRVPIHFRIAEK
jgi:hypothetical protein